MTEIVKTIDKHFSGLLSHDSLVYESLNNFFNMELNLFEEGNDISNALFICSEDENYCLDFAANIMHILADLNIISEYTYNPEIENIPCIFNGFKENPTWDKIVNLAIANKILIICANKDVLVDIKNHSEDSFYDIFAKEIHLKPITVDQIIHSSHYMFDNLVEDKKYIIEDSFYPSLEKYITTVYNRSAEQGKNFILDLVYRVTQRNIELNQEKTFNENSIPFYIQRENTSSIINKIKDKFIFSACINDLIDFAKISNEISKLSLVNSPASFDAIIKSSNLDNVKTFAKLYADLLYSENFKILPSNKVTYIEAARLLYNNSAIEGKHGLFVITQSENYYTFDELKQINAILEDYKKIYNNRIVWLLQTNSLGNQTAIKSAAPALNHIYDLDFKTEESIRKFYDAYTKQKDINIIESEYNRIYSSLSLANNVQEAVSNLDKIVAHYITNENDKITLHYSSKVEPTASVSEDTIIVEKKEEPEVIKTSQDNNSNKVESKPSINNYTFSDVEKEELEISKMIQDIPYNEDEPNVLLLALSTLPKFISVNKYKFVGTSFDSYDNNLVSGCYIGQLEPSPKMLAKVLASQNKRLDYIYVLTSYEVDNNKRRINLENFNSENEYTALEFFKERCKCLFGEETDKRIIDIKTYKDADNIDIESALYELNSDLSKGDNNRTINLYLDNHGAGRTYALITDAISMLIDHKKNVKLIDTYSVNHNKNQGFDYTFTSSKQDKQIFNFVSGINEFLNFGSSKSLSEFINSTDLNQDDQALIDAINNVSEAMKVCNTEGFENSLKTLNNLITNRKQQNSNSYLDIVIDMIKDDYQVDKESNLLVKTSVPKELKWCANKEHIQQALTLMEARTAKYLSEKGILTFKTKDPNVLNQLYNDFINTNLVCGANKKNNNTYYFKDNNKDILNVKNLEEIEKNNFSLNSIYKIINTYKNPNLKGFEEKYKVKINKNRNKMQQLAYDYYHNNRLIVKQENSCNALVEYPFHYEHLSDKGYREALYNFLYVQKKLKESRNMFNHFSNSQYTTESIKQWINIYLILLDNLEKQFKRVSNSK